MSIAIALPLRACRTGIGVVVCASESRWYEYPLAQTVVSLLRYRSNPLSLPPPASLPSHTSDHSISITDCAHSIIEILVPLRDQG